MGSIFSTPENVNPSSSTPQQAVQQEPSNAPLEETAPTSPTEADAVGETQENKVDGEGDAENEEEGDCGFCVFMKGGGCKESFVAWEKCLEECEKNKEDVLDKCASVTIALKACMEVNPDYYGPFLKAEKEAEAENEKQSEESKAVAAAEAQAAKELGNVKEAETELAGTAAEAQAAKELGNVKEADTASEAQAAKELRHVKEAETAPEADEAKELEGKKESKSEESEPVVIIEQGKEGNSSDSE